MTIGNLPKGIRRKPSRQAQVLLGYLPTTSLKENTSNQAARRQMLANLFHKCIDMILSPLKGAGKAGVTMRSGDGKWRRCHPILAAFIGDYPEQLLVACVKKGCCPICPVKRSEIGEPPNVELGFRDLDTILTALDTLKLQQPTVFSQACTAAGIKPIQEPFWKTLPYVNIYSSITPDILHQLYQGVVKHLVEWLKTAFSEWELNSHCQRLPPNHQTRLFTRGITHLQRVTGKEHAQICSIILGVIIDIRLPNNLSPHRLIRFVRALLDFVFIAQYPVHNYSSWPVH